MPYLSVMDIALKISNSDESTYILAIKNGERWAQKKLYEDSYSSLFRIAMRYAGNSDDAADILHESYIKIFKNIHNYLVNSSLLAWMSRIVINTAIDYYWKENRRKTENLESAFFMSSNTPDAISIMSNEEIIKAMQRLPNSYRSVFNLYVIEGFSHREIAKMLGINESTCRSNLVKARAKLRSYLMSSER